MVIDMDGEGHAIKKNVPKTLEERRLALMVDQIWSNFQLVEPSKKRELTKDFAKWLAHHLLADGWIKPDVVYTLNNDMRTDGRNLYPTTPGLKTSTSHMSVVPKGSKFNLIKEGEKGYVG